MSISNNSVVSFHYTLTDSDGKQLDQSNDERGPLTYLHGAGNIIPGLEKQLEGKNVGDKLTAKVPAAEAYGERSDNLIQELPANMFTGVEKVEVGMEFQAQTEQGTQIVRVAAVEGDTVTIDANHPLAGVDLNFDVEVTEVRDATEEEISHGHVHGPEGHEH
ncbi:peptidylprolyl isomerase [Marinimicrobium sp. C6131]|uniref:FKBP-type peptidyl-prolyl cis-trans isomerase n=1 Tax=Marinimicrobium sp. C6131 TaxID=3022676 RepID=UPI00223CADF0|nr:peptidylprolyl isomerase [Marinimicrobium sp. C6131]UZJ44758.1 peptidylprolyl isomerase [Marinimicrobium sp. C6131]